MPRQADGVRKRFGGEAQRWDAVYTGRTGWFGQLRDRVTRGTVHWRLQRAFDQHENLRGRTVLDLGCGSGRSILEALNRGAERVVGIDLAPQMVDASRRTVSGRADASRVELRSGNVEEIKIGEQFDLVIANGLFDYLDRPGPFLHTARRWCRGTFVASFPARYAVRTLPRRVYWAGRGIRIKSFTKRELARLAKQAGFGQFELESRGPLHLLIARAT